jgi:hypothetical protein
MTLDLPARRGVHRAGRREFKLVECQQQVQGVEHEILPMHGPVAAAPRLDGPSEFDTIGALQQARLVAADYAQADPASRSL